MFPDVKDAPRTTNVGAESVKIDITTRVQKKMCCVLDVFIFRLFLKLAFPHQTP